ncbi:hypothetical protein [Nocardia sp. NPDC048505]|uniref:tetratricopeptide repeat protein n=1 Tax=unclassified Nocardia TaxID=2637762 RepID=UPI0033D94228
MYEPYSHLPAQNSADQPPLAARYQSADPIRLHGSLVYPMYSEQFGPAATTLTMYTVSAAPPPGLRGHGIGLSVTDGYIGIDGRQLGGVDVWSDVLSGGVTFELTPTSPQALFTLTPVWVDETGAQKSWTGNYGIVVETAPDGRMTLWCSVGEGPANFANLVIGVDTGAGAAPRTWLAPAAGAEPAGSAGGGQVAESSAPIPVSQEFFETAGEPVAAPQAPAIGSPEWFAAAGTRPEHGRLTGADVDPFATPEPAPFSGDTRAPNWPAPTTGQSGFGADWQSRFEPAQFDPPRETAPAPAISTFGQPVREPTQNPFDQSAPADTPPRRRAPARLEAPPAEPHPQNTFGDPVHADAPPANPFTTPARDETPFGLPLRQSTRTPSTDSPLPPRNEQHPADAFPNTPAPTADSFALPTRKTGMSREPGRQAPSTSADSFGLPTRNTTGPGETHRQNASTPADSFGLPTRNTTSPGETHRQNTSTPADSFGLATRNTTSGETLRPESSTPQDSFGLPTRSTGTFGEAGRPDTSPDPFALPTRNADTGGGLAPTRSPSTSSQEGHPSFDLPVRQVARTFSADSLTASQPSAPARTPIHHDAADPAADPFALPTRRTGTSAETNSRLDSSTALDSFGLPTRHTTSPDEPLRQDTPTSADSFGLPTRNATSSDETSRRDASTALDPFGLPTRNTTSRDQTLSQDTSTSADSFGLPTRNTTSSDETLRQDASNPLDSFGLPTRKTGSFAESVRHDAADPFALPTRNPSASAERSSSETQAWSADAFGQAAHGRSSADTSASVGHNGFGEADSSLGERSAAEPPPAPRRDWFGNEIPDDAPSGRGGQESPVAAFTWQVDAVQSMVAAQPKVAGQQDWFAPNTAAQPVVQEDWPIAPGQPLAIPAWAPGEVPGHTGDAEWRPGAVRDPNPDLGYRGALYDLGVAMYGRGEEDEACGLWAQAAEAGHAAAAYDLGVVRFRRGDVADTERWWRVAADNREPRAMSGLAELLDRQGNYAEAGVWREAAEQQRATVDQSA